MVLDLYYVPRSPACYTVQMVAKAVNVELNLKELDLTKGEHLTPEFLKVLDTVVIRIFFLMQSLIIFF